MLPAALLHLEDVAIEAGGVRLLEAVGVELGPGELVALTGPSGVGKTTLLRVVAGLDDPAAGRVTFEGEGAEVSGHPAFRRRVVLLAQQPVLFDATVLENLQRPFNYGSAREAFDRDRAAALLQQLGIEADRLEQNARTLSVGQQQRVCLVRALLVQPRVLLLDEPTSALDQETAAVVLELLAAWVKEERRAALLVTHDVAQVQRWCGRQVDLGPFVVAPPELLAAAAAEGAA